MGKFYNLRNSISKIHPKFHTPTNVIIMFTNVIIMCINFISILVVTNDSTLYLKNTHIINLI